MTGLEIIRRKIGKVENEIQGYELSQTNTVIQKNKEEFKLLKEVLNEHL